MFKITIKYVHNLVIYSTSEANQLNITLHNVKGLLLILKWIIFNNPNTLPCLKVQYAPNTAFCST